MLPSTPHISNPMAKAGWRLAEEITTFGYVVAPSNGLRAASLTNLIQLWKVDGNGEERKVTYLSTLIKHTQAVNVVRWSPRGLLSHRSPDRTIADTRLGEILASAGDDGNVLLWVPSETQSNQHFGEDSLEDKETWRVKHMCRSMGTEIYDLAWSPDGQFFITGSTDNVVRIYNAHNGKWSSSKILDILIYPSDYRTANCRAQSLCSRRCLGPSE